jgi:hypothetical protein
MILNPRYSPLVSDTLEGRRYDPVIIAANGRAKPNWVMVNGRPEKYESGVYYLERYENGKRKPLSVGRDSDAADGRNREDHLIPIEPFPDANYQIEDCP